MGLRVYLSKSNQANPDHVMAMRKILAEINIVDDIIEFKGGDYSQRDVIASDVLIIVPPANASSLYKNDRSKGEFFYVNGDNYTRRIYVGKGQHGQIDSFRQSRGNTFRDIYMVNTELLEVIVEEIENDYDDNWDHGESMPVFEICGLKVMDNATYTTSAETLLSGHKSLYDALGESLHTKGIINEINVEGDQDIDPPSSNGNRKKRNTSASEDDVAIDATPRRIHGGVLRKHRNRNK